METRESLIADIAYLDACITDIHERAGDAALPEDQAADFKAGVQLRDEKRAALKNIEERHAELERLAADKPAAIERGDGTISAPNLNLNRNADPFDFSSLRLDSTRTEVRDRGLAAIEMLGVIRRAVDDRQHLRAGLASECRRARDFECHSAMHLAILD